MGKVIMLSDVRCSFVVVGEPKEYKTGDGKWRWSATPLVPYDNPQKQQVDTTIREVAAEKWGGKAGKVLETVLNDRKACAWLDGKHKDYEGYEGHYYLSAYRYKKAGPPAVMTRDKRPIYYRGDKLKIPAGIDPEVCVLNQPYPGLDGAIYSGAYCNLQVEIYALDDANGKQIRATLLGIQFWRHGDAFGGGRAPDENAFALAEDAGEADDMAS